MINRASFARASNALASYASLPATRALFLVGFGHLTIEICMNFLPIVYPLLIQNLGLTWSQIGTIALVSVLSMSLAQPLFGYLCDHWDPHLVTVFSIVWIGLFMGTVGFSWGYASLLVLVALGSLGSAAFHPAGAAIATASAGSRRGAALSIFSVGGNVGTALAPVLVAVGIGWLGMGGTSVVIPIALLSALLIHWQLAGYAPARNTGLSGIKSLPGNGFLLGLILIVIAVMFRSWFQLTLVTYLPSWVETQGHSLTLGAQMLFVFSISVGLGSFIGGVASDRVGRWQVLAVSLGGMAPSIWIFITATPFWQMVLAGFMGILVGATYPTAIVLAQETWPSHLGVVSGLVMGIAWLPGGIGASVTGYIADQFTLTVGLQTLVIPPVLGLACILAFAVLQRSWQRTHSFG